MRFAIGEIDDKLVEGAREVKIKKTAKYSWLKWSSVVAVLALVIALGVFALPGMLKDNDPVTSVTPDNTGVSGNEGGNSTENKFEKGYTYSVDEGKYSTYVQGKVIADKYVGGKLEDVTVTAGWMDADRKMLTEEHAKAGIYEITGVSKDVAVAIKFIDELEAETTTQFYVIMNPTADLTPVQPYVIAESPWEQSDGNEAVNE